MASIALHENGMPVAANTWRNGIPTDAHTLWHSRAMERLVGVVQELSQARDIDHVMRVVRTAARALTGADGATFVLRDGQQCYYADEDAISPLWKGQRFPMTSCISGWVMQYGLPAVIEDIYNDMRIPAEAYKPTFVKSLVMVPIRQTDPVGAIGTYWAKNRLPSEEELSILQALADVTSVAIENATLYGQLQIKILALEEAKRELQDFTWAASHNLKAPLYAIDNLSQWLHEELEDTLEEPAKSHLANLRERVGRMNNLLGHILDYSHLEGRNEPRDNDIIDGETLLFEIKALIDFPPGFTLQTSGCIDQMRVARLPMVQILYNMIGNALKHHDRSEGLITLEVQEERLYYRIFVGDDGPGISHDEQQRIFNLFQAPHNEDHNHKGGMGLALVKKVLLGYGSTLTVDSGPERGSVFCFNWPKPLQNMAAKSEND